MFDNGSFLRRRKRYKRQHGDPLKDSCAAFFGIDPYAQHAHHAALRPPLQPNLFSPALSATGYPYFPLNLCRLPPLPAAISPAGLMAPQPAPITTALTALTPSSAQSKSTNFSIDKLIGEPSPTAQAAQQALLAAQRSRNVINSN